MDLNQVTMTAQMAMENRDFPKALHFLSMALAHLAQVASPVASVFLLVQRAECFWQMGEFQASVTDMEQAIRAGLAREFKNSQEEIWKWTDHGFSLYEKRDYYLAERCVNIAFYFRDDPLVQTFLCRALIRFELKHESEARKDIAVIKRFDSRLAENSPGKTGVQDLCAHYCPPKDELLVTFIACHLSELGSLIDQPGIMQRISAADLRSDSALHGRTIWS
ncbi:hypothetical protein P5673_021998 [Acropora cervicornis]|uniref:Uncharacterized protein n=1 Tax=Acropora cervicornis TaxID=6130 RepID=A0AAD9UZV0_ACRCE|nr:hypothetical protein P5673_021998 [Acropora cervicornis]